MKLKYILYYHTKMFLALSPIILCSIHPWFWNALYNVHIILSMEKRRKGWWTPARGKVYFVYFAIFYESFKVTVNASCKFKDWSRIIEDDLIELVKRISWSDEHNQTDEFFEIFYSTHVLSDEFAISRWIFVESRSLKRLKFSLGYENRSDRSIKMTMMIVWLLFRVNKEVYNAIEASIKLYREIISSKDNGFWKFVAIVKHWFVGSLINVF